MNAKLVLLLPLAVLAACDKGAESSNVKIDTGGFKADLDLPGFSRISEGMEIDGVKLYPGSKVSNISVDAKRENDGRFTMRFSAPADRAKVGGWFAGQFRENGFAARATPTGFAGNTKDGDWFTLDLTAAGAQTSGEFRLGKGQVS